MDVGPEMRQTRRLLEARIAELEAALAYIARETGDPNRAAAAACDLAHGVATEALRKSMSR